MANPGTMTFGTAQRLPKPGKSGVPGPGHYKVRAAAHVVCGHKQGSLSSEAAKHGRD